jgi:hypothetical protein
MPYVAIVTLLGAFSPKHHSLFPRFDVVQEGLIHVDDDCGFAAQTVPQNMSHPTQKDSSTVLDFDLCDGVRDCVGAPCETPPLAKIPAPTLGGLCVSQLIDELRTFHRQRHVLKTAQKELQNSNRRHQQTAQVQTVNDFSYIAFNQKNRCLLPQRLHGIRQASADVVQDGCCGPLFQMMLCRHDRKPLTPSVLPQLAESNTVQCEVRAATQFLYEQSEADILLTPSNDALAS